MLRIPDPALLAGAATTHSSSLLGPETRFLRDLDGGGSGVFVHVDRRATTSPRHDVRLRIGCEANGTHLNVGSEYWKDAEKEILASGVLRTMALYQESKEVVIGGTGRELPERASTWLYFYSRSSGEFISVDVAIASDAAQEARDETQWILDKIEEQ